MSCKRIALWLTLPVLGFLAVAAITLSGRQRASQLFREAVLDPVPTSVKQIRADRARWFNKYTYVLRFDVSPDDLAVIVRSGPFEEISYVEYDRGSLTYGETKDATSSVWLYEVPRGDGVPEWFDLPRWAQFRAYIAEKEAPDLYNVRLLLYHEGRGQAYFLEHEMRGKWERAPIGKEYRRIKREERTH